MNRLTNKECYSYEDFVFSLRNKLITPSEIDNAIYKKLKSLEDIEEELGIDLIILFKALKYGFYFKYKNKIISSNNYLFQITVNIKGNWIFDIVDYYLSLLSIKLKDYGKTWALTKEELEYEI